MKIREHGYKIVAAFALLLIPMIFSDNYITHIVSIYYLYVIMAIGLSIVVSYAGLLDLGYVAFFAVGAYLYAILNTAIHLPFLVAIPLAALAASTFGFILGFPTLRVRGDYLALVTLAFGEMIRTVLTNWTTVTNGPKGIYAIDSPGLLGFQFSLPGQYYYIVLVILGASMLLFSRLTSSPVALIWEALRDDEIAANSSGINPQKYYLMAFAIGASFAGIVGVLFASIQKFVSPESFVLDESILVLSIVVLSGGKSVFRIFIAAALFYLVPELLREFKEYRLLIFGGFLIFFPIYEEKAVKLFSSLKRKASTTTDKPTVEATGHNYTPPISGNESLELKVSSVTKEFSGLTALDNVSFEQGLSKNVVGLIGPNGAGKSTLFNCLSGIEKITHGAISMGSLGRIEKMPPYVLASKGIGRTFQNVRLFKSMTVSQNILIGCYCGKAVSLSSALFKTKEFKQFINDSIEKADYYLDMLGLLPYKNQSVGSLPIGSQRKVEIARALATEPKLLLLDEVASGLNDAEKKDLIAVFQLITKKMGISILLVEHDMPFVLGLAEQIIVLDSGAMIAQGSPAEVSKDKKVIDAYLGASYALG